MLMTLLLVAVNFIGCEIFCKQKFYKKNLGHLIYFLGCEIGLSSQGLFQRKFLDLLDEIEMVGCKSTKSPMDPNNKLDIKSDLLSDEVDTNCQSES